MVAEVEGEASKKKAFSKLKVLSYNFSSFSKILLNQHWRCLSSGTVDRFIVLVTKAMLSG
jgi:hypothetical protein